METQAKFADAIYSRDAGGLFVNLFIPSEVTWAGRRDQAGARSLGSPTSRERGSRWYPAKRR